MAIVGVGLDIAILELQVLGAESHDKPELKKALSRSAMATYFAGYRYVKSAR